MKNIFILILVLLPSLLYSQAEIRVGRIQATDPEGTEVVYAITAGNTGSFFTITPCSGIIKVKPTAYDSFVLKRTWTLTIKATDETGLYTKTTRKVVLQKDGAGNKLPPVISDAL